jgi:hypothetical protein
MKATGSSLPTPVRVVVLSWCCLIRLDCRQNHHRWRPAFLHESDA